MFAKQWVPHVSGCNNFQLWRQPCRPRCGACRRHACHYRSFDPRQPLQLTYAASQLFVARKKLKSKRTRHSKPAIICRAAAEANNYFARPALRRIQNHFANAECVCTKWIALIFRKSPHTCGFAHFQHGKLSIDDPGVTRVDLAAEWIVRFALQPGTAQRITNHFSRSLAAIRHRHDVDLCATQNIAQTERDVLCHLARAERAFEFIRGD